MWTCPKMKKLKGQQEFVVLEISNLDEELEVETVANCKYDRQRVRKMLCILIIVDESPLNQYRINFNMFSKATNPRHKKISSHTIKNDCIKLFHEENAKLKNKLKD